MKRFCIVVLMMVSVGLAAQTTTTSAATGKKKAAAKRQNPAPAAVTAADVQALRDAIAAQQQQIQAMQQELQRPTGADPASPESLRQSQATASAAASKAAGAETAATQSSATVSKLQSDVADIKQNQTNAALTAQEDQKKISALDAALGRFRFTGDIRVRGEGFL